MADLRWDTGHNKPAKYFRVVENGFVLFYDEDGNLIGQHFAHAGEREFCTKQLGLIEK